MLLLCETDVLSIEVAKELLMMGFYSSFQSERHIAPFVILFITFSYHADRTLVQTCLEGAKLPYFRVMTCRGMIG